MRIIGGKLKGIILDITKSKNTRPLRDSARENIFNLLTHSNKVLFKFEESFILDLYSGTGSFGLECLSRNANGVYFIEENYEALKVLEHNIKKLSIKNKTKVYAGDVFSIIEKQNIPELKFNLIFCDPPFKNKNIKKLIELILNKNLLKKNGILVLHRNKSVKEKFPEYFKVLDERIYGVSKIIFGQLLY